jgi:hypothetical protein
LAISVYVSKEYNDIHRVIHLYSGCLIQHNTGEQQYNMKLFKSPLLRTNNRTEIVGNTKITYNNISGTITNKRIHVHSFSILIYLQRLFPLCLAATSYALHRNFSPTKLSNSIGCDPAFLANKIKILNFTHSRIRRSMTDKPYCSTIPHSKVLGNMEMENKMSKEEG